HSAPSVKTAVRTETVFMPVAAAAPPLPVPLPAPAPATATQPEKTFPFKNERPVVISDTAEAQHRQIEQLRADIDDAFKRAEALLAAEKFDAAQAELEEIAERVRRYPNELWQE